MRSRHCQTSFILRRLTAFAIGCLLTGCAVVGPASIQSGRLAYNDAITETNNQQLLMNVIRNRYVERGNLLAIASITANISVKSSVGVQLGIGDFDNYAGNLVPFGASTVYEENPTISYTPVEGANYSTQLLSPVPVRGLAQLVGTMADPSYVYTALVSNVNGIRNPDFMFSTSGHDPRFDRFVSIMTTITRAQRLHWFKDPQHADNLSIVIENYAPSYAAEVSELLDLLDLPPPKDPSSPVILPVFLGLNGRNSGGIGILTRSIFNLIEILSAAIEVPERDKGTGVATSYPAPGLAGKELRIRHSKAKPEHAAVAVKYRDGWFYIDETDQATKQFFRLLGALWSVAIAESTGKGTAVPVLTIPVSR